MSGIRVPAWLVPGESPLPALQMAAFLLYPHKTEKESERAPWSRVLGHKFLHEDSPLEALSKLSASQRLHLQTHPIGGDGFN